MSYWTHLTGIFRTPHRIGEIYTEEDKKNHIEFRNKQIKKICRAMEKLKDYIGYLYEDKTFSYDIRTKFKYKNDKDGFYYDEEIIVSFHGDLRNIGNLNKEINKLISKIWYEKGIYIKYGIAEIIGACDVDIMTYRIENSKFVVFKDTSDSVGILEHRIPNSIYNWKEESIIIDGRKWTREDILNNIAEFSDILAKYEIPYLIKNVNRRLW